MLSLLLQLLCGLVQSIKSCHLPVVDRVPGACSELASSYAALSAAKDVLKTDRKALSEAEAAHNVGKRLLEQRVATARCQVQGFMANQVGLYI